MRTDRERIHYFKKYGISVTFFMLIAGQLAWWHFNMSKYSGVTFSYLIILAYVVHLILLYIRAVIEKRKFKVMPHEPFLLAVIELSHEKYYGKIRLDLHEGKIIE